MQINAGKELRGRFAEHLPTAEFAEAFVSACIGIYPVSGNPFPIFPIKGRLVIERDLASPVHTDPKDMLPKIRVGERGSNLRLLIEQFKIEIICSRKALVTCKQNPIAEKHGEVGRGVPEAMLAVILHQETPMPTRKLLVRQSRQLLL